MDGLLTPVIVILVVAFAVCILIAVIRYARTNYVGIYKRFKKPVQTTGVIEWVECVDIPQGGCYYLTTYSYTDNAGERRTAAFKWHKRIGFPGDMIAIHFDSQDPESSIPDCQLVYGRNELRYTLIAVLSMIVLAVLSFLRFSK